MIVFVESRNQSPKSFFNSKKSLQPLLAQTVAKVSEHAFESVRKLVIRAVSNLHKGMELLLQGTAVVCFQASLAKTVVRDIPPVINKVSLFQTYKYIDSS